MGKRLMKGLIMLRVLIRLTLLVYQIVDRPSDLQEFQTRSRLCDEHEIYKAAVLLRKISRIRDFCLREMFKITIYERRVNYFGYCE